MKRVVGSVLLGCVSVCAIASEQAYHCTLRTVSTDSGKNNRYLRCLQGGGVGIWADSSSVSTEETLIIYDKNGGNLVSGDQVNIRACSSAFGPGNSSGAADYWLTATYGGGTQGGVRSALNANQTTRGVYETFRIYRVGGGAIRTGDTGVYFKTARGYYVQANFGVVHNRPFCDATSTSAPGVRWRFDLISLQVWNGYQFTSDPDHLSYLDSTRRVFNVTTAFPNNGFLGWSSGTYNGRYLARILAGVFPKNVVQRIGSYTQVDADRADPPFGAWWQCWDWVVAITERRNPGHAPEWHRMTDASGQPVRVTEAEQIHDDAGDHWKYTWSRHGPQYRAIATFGVGGDDDIYDFLYRGPDVPHVAIFWKYEFSNTGRIKGIWVVDQNFPYPYVRRHLILVGDSGSSGPLHAENYYVIK